MSSSTELEPTREVVEGGVRSRVNAALILAVTVFAACLFGIGTRPIGFLASFWPANAIMLGLLLRMPDAAKGPGWLGAALGFMAADLLTGSSLPKASILNAANMVGVGTAYFLYSRLPPEMSRLQQPVSMLCLVLISAAAGTAAGVVGGIANPLLFNGSVVNGWTFWFATELVNYIVVLPVILTAPPLRAAFAGRVRQGLRTLWIDVLPIAALLLSCTAALIVNGPGAIGFPVPALLWCGLAYPIFATAVITLLFGIWILVVISVGHLPGTVHFDEMELVSVRLGASLVALAPVMLASIMQSRNDLLARLRHVAMHDPLTGAESRSAFRENVRSLLADVQRPSALLMIDLDHFKSINDNYGHAGGDEVLVAFAGRIKRCLRPSDRFGRMGGEEFAVLIADCPEPEAIRIADRICVAVGSDPFILDDGRTMRVTTSIGAVIIGGSDARCIDRLLAEADAALYLAKGNGRNRMEIFSGAQAPHCP